MVPNANAHLTVKGTGSQRVQGLLEATGWGWGTASLVVTFLIPEVTGMVRTLAAPWNPES